MAVLGHEDPHGPGDRHSYVSLWRCWGMKIHMALAIFSD
jgi:hypothetical protein